MEKKQLHLDRPLLSVRRIPSQLPDEWGTKKNIPPRLNSAPLYTPEKDLTRVSKPGAVPFFWEKIPGRPKEEQEAVESESPVESASTPRLLDERNLMKKKSQVAATSPYDSNQESADEMYSDALETRSPTESFSFDCSLSGLSGNGSAEPRSSRTFSTDLQTRDFMMMRFLPAAKAMVIDPPQYVSRKHSGQLSGPLDQPKQPEKIAEQRKPSPPTTKPNNPNTSLQKQNQETEDPETDHNDDDDNCIDSIKKPAKLRGLFAKIRKINSLCLLKQIPGLKSRKHVVPTPCPAKEVNRMSRTTHSGPLPLLSDKNSLNTGNVQKMRPGSKSQEFPIPKKNPSSGSNRLNLSGELQTRVGSYPYRNNAQRTISPYRNQKPPSPFRGNGFVSVPKIVRNSEVNTFKNLQPSAPITPNITNSIMHSYPKVFSSLEDEESIDEAIMAEIFYQDRSIKSRAASLQLGSSGIPEEVQTVVVESRSELTPPLPKSPSESWLWRTIPSLKSPFQSHSKKQKDNVVSNPNSKWETIVKTSNKQHDHVRYSEELIPRISQHSKA
ncbi:uncharacterized protein LOC124934867 [Impatiens glandulifera]|uniref:uncharacterized protein LOC124934867 n=1 Tax=Impatiens glandulifera TaxID=253017 RepID=UPI001FB14FED|nr:uncharacterized protein LOC124934867 [Impatiens glandulifera]XP_047331327.1 uncharacterized protein LOC124934867 [Impatiens glandulifera]XP_047331331.1 uncharacterized protein LOC124934867 [Impatiens glandulifera]XP_047331337.1 uncharacterized protein LOC124934867 [Impatiens glandulifera]XP_047331344.1 uncharacterized protein LOC124934867 [Impatiens glandulifera]